MFLFLIIRFIQFECLYGTYGLLFYNVLYILQIGLHHVCFVLRRQILIVK